MNNIINPNELLNRAIYGIILFFFMLVIWCGNTLYNSNIELQNKMQEISVVMSKLTFTIDNTNKLFSDFKVEIKDMRRQISQNEKEISILKEHLIINKIR